MLVKWGLLQGLLFPSRKILGMSLTGSRFTTGIPNISHLTCPVEIDKSQSVSPQSLNAAQTDTGSHEKITSPEEVVVEKVEEVIQTTQEETVKTDYLGHCRNLVYQDAKLSCIGEAYHILNNSYLVPFGSLNDAYHNLGIFSHESQELLSRAREYARCVTVGTARANAIRESLNMKKKKKPTPPPPPPPPPEPVHADSAILEMGPVVPPSGQTGRYFSQPCPAPQATDHAPPPPPAPAPAAGPSRYLPSGFYLQPVHLPPQLHPLSGIRPPLSQTSTCPQATAVKRQRQDSGAHAPQDKKPHLEAVTPDTKTLHRTWQYTPLGRKRKNHIQTKGSSQSKWKMELTLVSYNILSQKLLEDNCHLYEGCDRPFLAWDYRQEQLLSQLRNLNADIVCLQEMQADHYFQSFKPRMKKLGYNGMYKKRTGDKPDGCAIFYKASKLDLDKASAVEYVKPGCSLMDRDNVGIILLLKPKLKAGRKTNTKLCVATTHLLFNPKRGDIKLAQLQLLLAEMDRIACVEPPAKNHSAQAEYHPTILCGDLNCEPFSPLHSFVEQGHLRYEQQVARFVSGQSEGQYSGSNRKVPKQLLPHRFGVSDRCQYLSVYQSRLRSWQMQRASISNVTTNTNKAQQHTLSSVSSPPQEGTQETVTEAAAGHASGAVKKESSEEIIMISDSDSRSNTPICIDLTENCLLQENSEGKPTLASDGRTQPAVAESDCYLVNSPVDASDDSGSSLSEATSPSQTPGGEDTQAAQCNNLVFPPFLQSTGQLSHSFSFKSVYLHQQQNPNINGKVTYTKEITSYHGKTCSTLDYIFYTVEKWPSEDGRLNQFSEQKLKLLGTTKLPTTKQMKRFGTLPNRHHSSDHLELVARFELICSK